MLEMVVPEQVLHCTALYCTVLYVLYRVRAGHPGRDGQPPLHLRHGGRGALQRQVVGRIDSANENAELIN